MLGEDVEDQGRTVDDLDLDDVFEVDELAGAQLTVADDGVRARFEDDVPQFVCLAGADVGGRVRLVAALDHAVEHERARGLREGGQLGQRVLRVPRGSRGPDTDEYDALQAELTVLDLGDVLEFGGEARDTAQGRTVGSVELVAVPLSVDLEAPGDVLFHQGIGPKILGVVLREGALCGLGRGRRGGHWVLTSIGIPKGGRITIRHW